MNRQDLAAYDAYPALLNTVVGCARQLGQLPLDDMGRVLDRVETAGCYNTQGRTTPVTPEQVARHRALIEAARAFRDEVAHVVTMPAGGDW